MRLGEGARLFHVSSSRHEEDLGADVLGLEFAVLNLRRILPEGRSLDLLEVTYHKPLQRSQATALHTAVGLCHRWVLAKDNVALNLVLEHGHERLIGGVRTRDAWHEVVAPLVVLGRSIAPVGLHEGDGVVLTDLPEALLVFLTEAVHVLLPVLQSHMWHRQVARQRVEQSRDIG